MSKGERVKIEMAVIDERENSVVFRREGDESRVNLPRSQITYELTGKQNWRAEDIAEVEMPEWLATKEGLT